MFSRTEIVFEAKKQFGATCSAATHTYFLVTIACNMLHVVLYIWRLYVTN